MTNKKTLLNVFMIFCLFILPPQVCANVTIGPNQLNFITKAGRESTKTVEVKNHTEQLYKIKVEIADALQEAGGMKFVYPGETSYSCSAWTRVTPEEITLEGHQTKTITIKIRPDPGVKGSFHGAVIFVVMPVVESESHYQVMGQIGAVVLTSVIIEGTLKPNVEALDASFVRTTPIRNVSMNMAAQPTVVLNLKNTGNCMVTVKGELVIRHSGTKRRIASGSILSINYVNPPTIPPGITRPILIPLNRILPKGEYLAATKFSFGERNRLSAILPMVVGDASVTGEDETEEVQVAFTPQILDMRMRPGAKRSAAISIINFEKKVVNLSAEILPLSLTSNGEPQIGVQPPETLGIDQYFELKFVTDKLAAGQKGRMVLMVKMPKQTDCPGLGLLRLKAEINNGDKNLKSFHNYPLLVSLDEAKPASLKVDSIDYFPAYNEQSPDRVVLTVQNDGTNYGLIKGTVEVREKAGFVYGSQAYGSNETMLILPGGKREVEILLKPKEHLQPDTNYVLNLQADIYEETMVRQRRIIKILDKKSQTTAFTVEKDGDDKFKVVINENDDQKKQVASGPIN